MFFNFTYKAYIAIIGDIKKSKLIQDRNRTQEKLGKVLDEINHKYEDDIAAQFMITLGDEFQGLLAKGENTMEILTEIEHRMHPVKIRFGIGIGEISTKINRTMAIGADGPGYYKARAAVEYVKSIEKRKQIGAGNIRIEIAGDYEKATSLLNTIFSLLTVITSNWSDRQREIIYTMLKQKSNQLEIAEQFQIKQPTVHKVLTAGHYYSYLEAIETIKRVLGEVGNNYI